MRVTRGWLDMSIWAKKKPKMRPGLPYDRHTIGFLTGNRGDFSFDGHRLSSLYRASTQSALRLILDDHATFSLRKYSIPAVPHVQPSGEMT